jgi:hypothetical protein
MAGRGRIELYIFIAIELSIIRVSASLIIDIAIPGDRALGKDCRRRSADEAPGFGDNAAPQRRVERCIIYLADELRGLLCLIHGHPRRRTSGPAIVDIVAAGLLWATLQFSFELSFESESAHTPGLAYPFKKGLTKTQISSNR